MWKRKFEQTVKWRSGGLKSALRPLFCPPYGFNADPVVVGKGEAKRHLDGLAFRQSLMLLAASESGARSMPFLVDAGLRRDGALLAGPIAMFEAADGQTANFAGMLATDCRDRARHSDTTRRDDPSELLIGLAVGFCKGWASATAAPRWPLGTAVPMLVLSGGYDSFQPDTKAMVAAIGASARHVHVPISAHGVRGSGPCARNLISNFLTNPAGALDTACIATMSAPPFLLDVVPLSGPRRASVANALPKPLLIAAVAGMIGVLVALGNALHRRFRREATVPPTGNGWTTLAAFAGFVALTCVAAAVALHLPPDSAVLLFGLPSAFAWLPWSTLLPAVLGGTALWRGPATTSARIVAAAAIVVTIGLALAGWSPLG